MQTTEPKTKTKAKADRSSWVWSRAYNMALAHYGASWAANQAASEAVAAYRARKNGGVS